MKKKIPVKKKKNNKPVGDEIVFKKQGWVCPSCGGGVSPDVERCPCKPMNPLPTPYKPLPDIPWQPYPSVPPWKWGQPEIID